MTPIHRRVCVFIGIFHNLYENALNLLRVEEGRRTKQVHLPVKLYDGRSFKFR